MEFPIYGEFAGANLVVVPHFIEGLEISPRRYLEMLFPMFLEASVINATAHAQWWLEGNSTQLTVWARLPSLATPRHAKRFVEVDLRTVALSTDAQRAYGHGLPIGWAALVNPLSIDPGDSVDPWVPNGAATQIYMDLMVRWTEDQPTQVPVAQIYIVLDSEGRAMPLVGQDRSYWVVAPFGEAKEIELTRILLPLLVEPLVLALAEEHGELPDGLRPDPTPPASSAFPIRAAIAARQFTFAAAPLEAADEEAQAALQGFADRIMAAQPYDASAEAHRYLVEDAHPIYDYRTLSPLIPPAPSIYIEVEPPDRVLKEESYLTSLGQEIVANSSSHPRAGWMRVPSRVIPFSRLVGAGVGWSALVNYHPPTAHIAAFLSIFLNIKDAVDLPPRCQVALTILALDEHDRASTQWGTSSVMSGRKDDVDNILMWLQPIVMRLASFNG